MSGQAGFYNQLFHIWLIHSFDIADELASCVSHGESKKKKMQKNGKGGITTSSRKKDNSENQRLFLSFIKQSISHR